MHRARLLVVALAAGLITPPAVAAAAPPDTAPTPARAVTLISGDRALVDDRGALVRVEAAPGRTGMSFHTYVSDGHQMVVPEDARPLLAADRIDRRFFDVTALLDYGYEDAEIDHIPLLNTQLRAAAGTPKAEAARRWADLLHQPRVQSDKIWLNGKAKLSLAESVPQVGAPAAWQAGLDGAGVTVAVLDTGYDPEHPELQNVVTSAKDFTGLGIKDTVGHGTHVASTIAGRGTRYTGVAKGAKLAIGRVCEEFGCLESAIIAGMEWAARDAKAKVVNMSLGGNQSDGTDPMSQAVNRLTAETGTLFVIAAGNSGIYRKVGTPAAADAALAVANVTKESRLNDSSSRGPRIGDFAVKPDLAAPGTDIVAARAKGTLPDEAVGEHHARLTGTSMATPHVAGAAAILAQQHPDWTGPELKAHLMATAKQLPQAKPEGPGTGLLDVARATTQTLRADTGHLSFGVREWPHTEPVAKTVTYRNNSDKPVLLRLEIGITDENHQPVPDGEFRLSARDVTVPARGTAPVTVTLDGAKGLGKFSGHLTARGDDGSTIVTSVGAYVQEERHKLTVKIIGRDGRPAANGYLLLVNQVTTEGSVLPLDENGAGSVRLPVADYAVLGSIKLYDANRHWFAPISVTDVAGKVSLAGDADVTLDARQAKPVTVALDDDRVRPLYRQVEMSVPTAPGKNSGVSGGPAHGDTERLALPFGQPLDRLTYLTTMKSAQPRVALSGAYDFPVSYFDASPYITGKHTYRVTAKPEPGALVLVQLNENNAWDLPARAAEAKAAGAAAVLQVGPVPLPFEEQTAVPVVWATQHRAAGLVADVTAGKPVTVSLTGNASSPVSYNLYYPEKGALPAGKTYQANRRNLAEVKARYRSMGGDSLLRQRLYPLVDGGTTQNSLLDEVLVAPLERTEYYSAGPSIGWHQDVTVGRMFGPGPGEELAGVWTELESAKYAAGKKYSREWNTAVAAPAFGTPPPYTYSAVSEIHRYGDYIDANLSPFAAGPRAFESWVKTGWGTLELFRDGQSLGRSVNPWQGGWGVPAEQGAYELRLDAERSAPQLTLSTRVSTKWGFRSATSTGALPLLQVGYGIPLDIRNSARAGAPLPVKFTASRQPGAGKATVRELKAWASYDDGATWVPVKSVIPPGGKAGGFVSLRVTATDTDGNTVDQTVHRAYRLRA